MGYSHALTFTPVSYNYVHAGSGGQASFGCFES